MNSSPNTNTLSTDTTTSIKMDEYNTNKSVNIDDIINEMHAEKNDIHINDSLESSDTESSDMNTYLETAGIYLGKTISTVLNTTTTSIHTLFDSSSIVINNCKRESKDSINTFLELFKQK